MFQIVSGLVSTVNSAHACVNRDIQSSLTLSEVSTPAKLIGPVEARGLSRVNTS